MIVSVRLDRETERPAGFKNGTVKEHYEWGGGERVSKLGFIIFDDVRIEMRRMGHLDSERKFGDFERVCRAKK
jgi:hypothetical protein